MRVSNCRLQEALSFINRHLRTMLRTSTFAYSSWTCPLTSIFMYPIAYLIVTCLTSILNIIELISLPAPNLHLCRGRHCPSSCNTGLILDTSLSHPISNQSISQSCWLCFQNVSWIQALVTNAVFHAGLRAVIAVLAVWTGCPAHLCSSTHCYPQNSPYKVLLWQVRWGCLLRLDRVSIKILLT